MNSALAGRQGELQSHDCQKGTEEIAGEDPSILPVFLGGNLLRPPSRRDFAVLLAGRQGGLHGQATAQPIATLLATLGQNRPQTKKAPQS